MKKNRKKKFSRVVFGLNSFLFLIGGIGLIADNKLIFGILQIFAGILNIFMIIKFKNESTIKNVELSVLILNIIVCISISVDFIQSGKLYIQYVWMIAALMSTVALIVQFRKKKKTVPNNGSYVKPLR